MVWWVGILTEVGTMKTTITKAEAISQYDESSIGGPMSPAEQEVQRAYNRRVADWVFGDRDSLSKAEHDQRFEQSAFVVS